VVPPVRCPPDASHATLRRVLDLMSFQEELLASALERMCGSLRQLLGPLPSVHNVPLGESGLPASMARIDRVVDINGLDYYHQQEHLDVVKERTLRMVGSVRFPYAPELGIGAPPWFAPRSDADSLQTLLCACAYGIRGLNLYMAVDRDRWYGAPFDELGQERPNALALRRVINALVRTQFHSLTRRVEVGIMLPKEYARLSRATHTLGALSPSPASAPVPPASTRHSDSKRPCSSSGQASWSVSRERWRAPVCRTCTWRAMQMTPCS
jgi:beta-galactosidase